jgi:hypothetical protein
MHKIIAALAAALLIAAPFAANAQDEPSYAQGDGDGQIRGRVVAFDGAYNLQVRDDKGYIDNVELHQGTIINPTGLTLAPGMVVSILGYNAGDNFAANEIDTPYQFSGGYAYYEGRPWTYYVGPAFSVGFFFGNVGWWHGGYFAGPYHYNGGVRIYNNVNFNAVYRSGGVYGGYHGGYAGGYAHPGYANGGYAHTYPNGGYSHPAYNGNGNYGYHAAPNGGYHPTTGVYRAPAGGERGAYHGGGDVRGGGGQRGDGGDHGDHGHR